MGRIAGVTPAETRERLVDAAARVFERDGFEGATVAQIANEAGVSSGAIYAHYGSKAELLVDALRVYAERAISSLFASTPRDDVAALLLTLASRLRTRDRADTALISEALLASRRDAELAAVLSEAVADHQRFMTSMLARGQADGVLADDIPADVSARFALTLSLGSMLVGRLDLPPIDRNEWDALLTRVLATLAAGRPAGPGADDQEKESSDERS